MKKNIFIVGLDEFGFEKAKAVPGASDYRYHALLNHREVVRSERYDFNALVDKALRELRAFDGSVDAIIAHWDFPVSTMIPILKDEYGIPHASLEATLKCEHKYWSRVEQSRVVPDMVPPFEAINPFDDKAAEHLSLDFPFWLKPIKAFASHLGFLIRNEEELKKSLAVIRGKIRRIGVQFNEVLARADLPPEIRHVDGTYCIAEKLISGWQCGVEGYCLGGKVEVHGIFDCYKDRENRSFTRYEYPGSWPEPVQQKMIEASKKLMSHIGYCQEPFCVEFSWDPGKDRLWIIEINTRISNSHSDQFEKVEGFSNHEIAIKVDLGLEPSPRKHSGPFNCAAKFHLRRYHDGKVIRVPDEANLARLEQEIPGTLIHVSVEPGEQLSHLRDQDSQSYEIATLVIGAPDQPELLQRFRRCADLLEFEFSDGGHPEEIQFVEPVSWEAVRQ